MVLSWSRGIYARFTLDQTMESFVRCHSLALAVYRASEHWPPAERYALSSQIRRAALSAPTNIAEGCAKRGRSEFRRFLSHSIGSLSEVGYLLLVARDLGMLSDPSWSSLEQERDAAARVTFLLYRSLDPAHSRPS